MPGKEDLAGRFLVWLYTMIIGANCKINLGLLITEKRPDGYHNLETVFYPVKWMDALEVCVSSSAAEKVTFRAHGIAVDGRPEDNLVVKAYALLDRQFDLPPVTVDLLKGIPLGAGLGGGSSDAAHMLKLLNGLFGLKLTDDELEAYAAQLGADCAFFIRNCPVYAEGIGNVFAPVDLSLKGYQIVVVKPPVFVSTREAFARICPHRPEVAVKEAIARPVSEWKDVLVNDFEASVFPQHPLIGEVKEELYRQGAVYASMSGSGSSVFGLFAPEAVVPEGTWGPDMYVFNGRLD